MKNEPTWIGAWIKKEGGAEAARDTAIKTGKEAENDTATGAPEKIDVEMIVFFRANGAMLAIITSAQHHPEVLAISNAWISVSCAGWLGLSDLRYNYRFRSLYNKTSMLYVY